MIATAALVAIWLVPGQFAFADSSVWKVSKGDTLIYLGGTLHVLSKGDYPLPAEFDEAYRASEIVVFETDIVKISQPAFQQEMLSTLTYENGRTIRDELKPGTINLLEAHFSQRGIPFERFELYKPAMVSLLISMIELQALGISSQGVDQFFSIQAVDDNKTQLELESPQQQLAMIATMAGDKPDRLILHTLRDAKNLRTIMEDLVAAWRTGDTDRLDTEMIEVMQRDYPNVYENLLVTRNNNWLPAIMQLFASDEIEFVLVGAGHLVGRDGLLMLLEQRGYRVEQL
ncbi:hypothetical protein AB833_28475 [Chromatiales bacterium (ex Bugula neritina AB1)]|nr:hypothetical protein AB833_28475 [Chromatiales bacterium (ex Bugula neritina AB1)]